MLRIQPVQRAGEWNCLTHVLQAADPGYGALNTHAESRVGHAAILAQVQVPLERLFRQAVLVNTLHQQLIRSHALRAADDFAIAFGGELVHAEGQIGALWIGLHVERLHHRGITMHHYRTLKLRRDVSLVWRAKVAAVLELVLDQAFGVGLLQHLDGLIVRDARKRGVNLLQLADVAPDGFQLGPPALQATLHDEGNEFFSEDHEVVEIRVGDLRLYHPEFGEVTARL